MGTHHNPPGHLSDLLTAFERDLVVSLDPINVICYDLPASRHFRGCWLGVSAWRSWRAKSLEGLRTIIRDSYPNAVFHIRERRSR